MLSGVAICLTLGSVRRVPIGSAEADALYEPRPASRGRLALARAGRLVTGRRVAVGLLRHALEAWAIVAMLACSVLILYLW
jgi:hypothetical protein